MNILRALTGSRHKDESQTEAHHDVTVVRFEWDRNCMFQKTLPASMIPRQGDRVRILSSLLVLEGTAAQVLWIIFDGDEPDAEYFRNEDKRGSYARAKARVTIRLQDTTNPPTGPRTESQAEIQEI